MARRGSKQSEEWKKKMSLIMKTHPKAFKKGMIPWSKTVAGKGIMKPNRTSFKKGLHYSKNTEFTSEGSKGANNINWKGDKVGYFGLHTWVQRTLGKAEVCVSCGKKDGRIEWANKSYRYLRDVNDWISLCKKCHAKYDKDNWGLTSSIFNFKKQCV